MTAGRQSIDLMQDEVDELDRRVHDAVTEARRVILNDPLLSLPSYESAKQALLHFYDCEVVVRQKRRMDKIKVEAAEIMRAVYKHESKTCSPLTHPIGTQTNQDDAVDQFLTKSNLQMANDKLFQTRTSPPGHFTEPKNNSKWQKLFESCLSSFATTCSDSDAENQAEEIVKELIYNGLSENEETESVNCQLQDTYDTIQDIEFTFDEFRKLSVIRELLKIGLAEFSDAFASQKVMSELESNTTRSAQARTPPINATHTVSDNNSTDNMNLHRGIGLATDVNEEEGENIKTDKWLLKRNALRLSTHQSLQYLTSKNIDQKNNAKQPIPVSISLPDENCLSPCRDLRMFRKSINNLKGDGWNYKLPMSSDGDDEGNINLVTKLGDFPQRKSNIESDKFWWQNTDNESSEKEPSETFGESPPIGRTDVDIPPAPHRSHNRLSSLNTLSTMRRNTTAPESSLPYVDGNNRGDDERQNGNFGVYTSRLPSGTVDIGGVSGISGQQINGDGMESVARLRPGMRCGRMTIASCPGGQEAKKGFRNDMVQNDMLRKVFIRRETKGSSNALQ